MVTVLLAIDNDRPNQAVFNFAVQFCRRMKAKLDIIQIIPPFKVPQLGPNGIKSIKPGFLGNYQEPFISYKQSLQADDPDQAIAQYVRAHRDVVLTIYDTRRRKCELLKRGKSHLSQTIYPQLVPLVMARQR